jgi:predicted metal-dependent peptidase
MRQYTKLDKAKTQFSLDQAFFASILFKHPLVARDDIPTAAVDKRGTVYYNPKWIESLPVPEIIGVLAHECMHWAGDHFTRKRARDMKKWNYATDAVINDTLKQANIQLPKDCVDMPGSWEKTPETVYDELPDNPGGGQGQGQGGMGEDMLDEGELSDAEVEEIKARVRQEVAEAKNAAKMRGQLPTSLEKWADSIINVKTPWFEILERYMTNFVKGERTWSRPNRRFIAQNVYLPAIGKSVRMGPIAFLDDVSGSVSQPEQAHFGGHFKRIAEQCQPEQVDIYYCDAAVGRHDTFENPDDVEFVFMSGGGTDMVEGLIEIAKQEPPPEVVVVLTDGYTNWPAPNQFDFPIIWVISSDQVAPEHAGITVHFDMDHAEDK